LNAYVIHARPFRETSLLIEFFTQQLGRCSAVAKGAYRGKSPSRSLLQIFNFLTISLQGGTELLNLTQVERTAAPHDLSGSTIVCGLYLNELLYYTLHHHDPHPVLFNAYHQALMQLSTTISPVISLRQFEFVLLEELGYGVNFDAIATTECYRYDANHGFQVVGPEAQNCFHGAILLQLAAQQWQSPGVAAAAKQLSRQALAPLLAGKEIRSRELFI
jgi:DNA repair protein RecO (recombination protein O)